MTHIHLEKTVAIFNEEINLYVFHSASNSLASAARTATDLVVLAPTGYNEIRI